MIKLFISRKLSPSSIFWKLRSSGFEITDHSLIEFSLIPFQKIPSSDWIFFYSKNGIQYFINGLKKSRKSFPSCKFACMGEGTAHLFQTTFNRSPDFIGSGKPENVALQFSKHLEPNTKVNFITAKDTQNSVFHLLKEQFNQLCSMAVYTNQIKKIPLKKQFDVLIFTSPKNVIAYFRNNPLTHHQTIISIGKTTARQLHTIGISEVVIAVEPSEKGLLQAVKILYP